MEFFWFWLLVLLLVFAVAAWPAWPYTRNWWPYSYGGRWSYLPTLSAVTLVILLLLLGAVGVLMIATP